MGIRSRVVTLLLGALVWQGLSEPFALSLESGQAMVRSRGTEVWTAVGEGAAVGFGDSLLVPAPHTAGLRLDSAITLLLKDSCTLVLSGSDSIVQLELIRGQVFLKRHGDTGLGFRINAGSCTFIPVGTAAAVKISDSGEPRVAVLRGKMRIGTPSGESLDVASGFFASFDPAGGTLTHDRLPPKAIQSLSQWSGVELEEEVGAEAVIDRKAEEAEVVSADTAKTVEGMDAGADAQSLAVNEADSGSVTPNPPEASSEEPGAPSDVVAEVPDGGKVVSENIPEVAGSEKEVSGSPVGAAEKKTAGRAVDDEKRGGGNAVVGSSTANVPPATVPEGETSEATEQPKDEAAGTKRQPDQPTYQIGAGTVTVGDEQWTRIAFAIDLPIWRFGIGLDVELFLDAEGKFSNKGWDFSKDGWAEALSRKVRYVRFNHPGDPVYLRFMGLENVTFGYGFIVDRFTNMLRYPDQKLLGLQFELNDISPIGVSLQAMVADFLDFRNDGGVLAGRFALKPLKPTGTPILERLDMGVIYATDRNQYAPAREWDFGLKGEKWDRDEDGMTDSTYLYGMYGREPFYEQLVRVHRDAEDYDTAVEHQDKKYSRWIDRYSVLGFDMGLPLINTKLLGLDIYGQYGMSMDDDDGSPAEGWGIGAPGVALRAGPLWARLEYRRIQGMFEPGYFGPYYLEERIARNPVTIKESTLQDAVLNGVFGAAGLNILGFFTASATYQRLGKGTDPDLDQRFEATGGIGDVLLQKIPKLNRAEVYLYKTQIQRTPVAYMRTPEGTVQPVYDQLFFERTPNMYWGYRIGAEIMSGASIIWDTRYGWKLDENGLLVEDNQVILSAGLTF